MSDLISRQTVIDMVKGWNLNQHIMNEEDAIDDVNALLSAQPEPLTDKEQRIFLAAMAKEEKVCEEVDRIYPCEDSLIRVCREIKRKVKGALWA